MDRLGIGACGDVENPLGGEVALCGGPRADQVRLVGDPRVERIPVGLRVDGDGRDAELAERPEDTHRDLASVRDEHFGEDSHGAHILPDAWVSQIS